MYSLGDVDGVIGDRVQLCPRFPPLFASGLEFCVPGAGCVTADVTLGTFLTRGDHAGDEYIGIGNAAPTPRQRSIIKQLSS